MKNIFNKFAFFIALSFVFISCGNLTTSENDDSIPRGKGKIAISTDLQNGRSVLPTAIKEDTTGFKWELVGTSGNKTYSKTWDDDIDEVETVTAYQSMTSDSGIVIDIGTWDFTLTASNTDGKNILSATISTTINAGENKLNFVMQEATGDKAATGSIEFTLNFPENVVTKGIATLTPYEGTNPDTQDFTANAGTTSQFLSSITYKKENISAGYYILKIQLQQEKGDATTPTVEPKTINTYSCLIRVAPGLTSKGVYTLDELAQLYTITYKLNEGTFDSTTSPVPTSYNAYTSFELPEPTREGYEFVGWYTDENLQKLVQLDESNKYKITQDITLYAKWKISWDGLKNQIEKDSGISEFVITEDLTATSTITVSKPFKITSDKNVTITRGNTTGNTSFTDAFFEVESAGNLELEGKENSTITLDGGNANESPILATAPLITSSGNLTLKNCTLQNNKNTSTTPGGAIYISAGKFTMNGGIIGKEITGSDASTGKQSWQDAATETNHSNYAYAGGGGIYVASGDVTINGGKISYNYTRNPETDCQGKTPENTAAGGGISIVSGSLSLINSEVSYNSGYQGGGIRCYNDNTSNAGTLTLNKTLIKGNTSNPYKGSSFGGGLMVKNFNVTFEETTKSTIEQNYSGDGGALFLENTTSTLKNITIQNNSYNSKGYHYGSEVLLWANANVLIDDSNVSIASTEVETRGIFIYNNTNTLKLSGGAKLDAPVYLMSGTTVTVAGYLSSNTPPVATITPATCSVGTKVLTADDTSLLAQCVSKFALSDENYKISDDGRVAQNSGGSGTVTGTPVSDFSTLKTNIANAPTDGTVTELYLTNDINMTEYLNINSGQNIVLKTNGNYSIYRGSSFTGSFFTVNSGATFKLGNDDGIYKITLDGRTSSSETEGLSASFPFIKQVGTLTVSNCIMQYNKNSSSSVIGGAIYSEGTTTITNTSFMNNANTLESTTKGFGGAIYLLNNGDATISNCTFENNTTYQRGGAIYIGGSTSNTVITVSGSTFKNNIATNSTGNGGAICVSPMYGTVSLTSLTCSNNYVDNATLTSEDIAYRGTISSVTKNIGNISCENIYIDEDNTLNVIENINNTIKLTISGYVTGSQIINFNNFAANFTLSDTNYTISDDGKVVLNSGGYSL